MAYSKFDTYNDSSACLNMYNFISTLQNNVYVMATVYDEAAIRFNNYCTQALQKIGGGGKKPSIRGGVAMVGRKGAPVGFATEIYAPETPCSNSPHIENHCLSGNYFY